jgi:hypothetical protein
MRDGRSSEATQRRDPYRQPCDPELLKVLEDAMCEPRRRCRPGRDAGLFWDLPNLIKIAGRRPLTNYGCAPARRLRWRKRLRSSSAPPPKRRLCARSGSWIQPAVRSALRPSSPFALRDAALQTGRSVRKGAPAARGPSRLPQGGGLWPNANTNIIAADHPILTRFWFGNGPPGNCVSLPPTARDPRSMPAKPVRSINAATSAFAALSSPE